MMIVIKEAEKKDAEELAYLIQEVEATSEHMLGEAEERKLTLEGQAKMIDNLKETGNSAIFVCNWR